MSTHSKKVRPKQGRTYARRFAMQAFYQWQLVHTDVASLRSQFADNEDFHLADNEYFFEILNGVFKDTQYLDDIISPFLDRPIDQLDAVEHGILWVGTFELMHKIDIPYRVIINEAVEIAKRFGAEGGHKFINGILDKIAKNHRLDIILEPSDNPATPLS
ncbi:transcription antitermination protein [Gammaproteobacteria bacterium]|nr:transcription antitermination protein [Gammaproteobacteria bacterium]